MSFWGDENVLELDIYLELDYFHNSVNILKTINFML